MNQQQMTETATDRAPHLEWRACGHSPTAIETEWSEPIPHHNVTAKIQSKGRGKWRVDFDVHIRGRGPAFLTAADVMPGVGALSLMACIDLVRQARSSLVVRVHQCECTWQYADERPEAGCVDCGGEGDRYSVVWCDGMTDVHTYEVRA